MAKTDPRKSASAEGVKKISAIFVKVPFDGGATFKFFRQPFNLVEFNWGNGERSTYLELVLGNRFRSYSNEEAEVYDDVRILDGFSSLNNWPFIDRTSDISAR